MHPELYRSGRVPGAVALPSIEKALGPEWTKLEDNIMGEFGWKEVFRQFLGEDRAGPLAAAWEGDRYIVFEQKRTKHLVLVTRVKWSNEVQAARFFGQYSEALEKKHGERTNLFRRPSFFSFNTPDGDVFLHCAVTECLTVEGTTRAVFDAINKAATFPPVELPPADPSKPQTSVTTRNLTTPQSPAIPATR
jgi:hypothetical protein